MHYSEQYLISGSHIILAGAAAFNNINVFFNNINVLPFFVLYSDLTVIEKNLYCTDIVPPYHRSINEYYSL